MASNKKNHYVPIFYLKLFSANGRSINLFNIASCKTILDSNLRNQCYKDYFYGKEPELEKALGMIEDAASEIIRSIANSCELPGIDSSEYMNLVLHILLQYGRTAYMDEALNEQLEKTMKHIAAVGLGLTKEQLESVRIKQTGLGPALLPDLARLYPLLSGLGCKLLRITGDNGFVTCDNPVVLYNQLLSFRKHGGNTGIASKGLQIFFPMSPKLAIMLYDSRVYRVGSKAARVIDIAEKRDIDQLNCLQMVSAHENIYFLDPDTPVFGMFETSRKYRRKQKSKMQVFRGKETEFGREELIHSWWEEVRTDLQLSFVRVVKSAKRWRNDFQRKRMQPAVIVRNPELVRVIERERAAVTAPESQP